MMPFYVYNQYVIKSVSEEW